MIGNRIKEAREKAKLSQDELAKALKIGKRTLIDYEQNKTEPKVSILHNIAEICKISADWLILGKEETNNKVGEYKIPKLSLKASAGSGIQNFEISQDGYLYIPKWLFKTPQNQNNLKIIQVQGDSMEPTIKDNAYIIINTSITNLIDGAIYAILLDDQILIKRLQKTPKGILIISDNPKYQPITYNPKETNVTFQIIGKKILTIQD